MRDSQGGRPSREVSPRVFTAAALAAAGGPPGAPDERTDTQTVGQAHGGHDPAQGARRWGKQDLAEGEAGLECNL